MVALSLPTNTDVLTHYGLVGTIALVVTGVVVVRFVRSMLQRVFSLLIVAVLVVVIWGQRAALADCADKVKAAATAATGAVVVNPTCSVFGAKVTVPMDKLHPTPPK